MKLHSKLAVRQPGFTMLELAAVMAVIAILAGLALPSYLHRVVRLQIESSSQLADVAKKAVAASWATVHKLPLDNAEAGLPAADKMVSNYVSVVSVQDGAINITFGNSANSSIKGKILTMRPAVVEDAPVVPVAWVCAKAPVPKKMVVKGADQTSIPDNFLPLDCRLSKLQ